MAKLQPIYLVVGVPGAGKTWATFQVSTKFKLLEHDKFKSVNYGPALWQAAMGSMPVLGEVPFGISELKAYLESKGAEVTLIFIIEDPEILRHRYEKREKKPYVAGNITRQETYKKRAQEYGSFVGTSTEVLNHLKSLKLGS